MTVTNLITLLYNWSQIIGEIMSYTNAILSKMELSIIHLMENNNYMVFYTK